MLGLSTALTAPAVPSGASIDACYEHCLAIVRFHSKSFWLSSRFLPHHKRRAVWAAYAFCRTADDIVDRSTHPGERLAAIDSWEAQLRDCYDGNPSGPIFTAFADAVERFDIPLQASLDLLRGARMDITVSRYATHEALSEYCYHVASTVGVMMLPVLGMTSGDAPEYAIKLGHAMQLTNILRDVGEDAGMGRVYLPAEDLARFGYTEADLFAHTIDHRFVALMKFEIERARELYLEAEPGIDKLCPESRYSVRLALHLYRGILGAIEANRYDVFGKRAFVPLHAKISAALQLSFLR